MAREGTFRCLWLQRTIPRAAAPTTRGRVQEADLIPSLHPDACPRGESGERERRDQRTNLDRVPLTGYIPRPHVHRLVQGLNGLGSSSLEPRGGSQRGNWLRSSGKGNPMGKKPVFGLVGLCWLGLTISGCKDCGCNDGTRKVQGPAGTPYKPPALIKNDKNSSGWNNQPQSASVQSPTRSTPGVTGTSPYAPVSQPVGSGMTGQTDMASTPKPAMPTMSQTAPMPGEMGAPETGVSTRTSLRPAQDSMPSMATPPSQPTSHEVPIHEISSTSEGGRIVPPPPPVTAPSAPKGAPIATSEAPAVPTSIPTPTTPSTPAPMPIPEVPGTPAVMPTPSAPPVPAPMPEPKEPPAPMAMPAPAAPPQASMPELTPPSHSAPKAAPAPIVAPPVVEPAPSPLPPPAPIAPPGPKVTEIPAPNHSEAPVVAPPPVPDAPPGPVPGGPKLD